MIFQPAFRQGVRDALSVQLAITPFGMIAGAICAEVGLTALQALAQSTIVFAGAAQMASSRMLGDGAPVIMILLTGLCINLRFMMYSASLQPWWQGATGWQRALGAWILSDQAFGIAINRYQQIDEPVGDRVAYYFGVGILTGSNWLISTVVGHWLGRGIPPEWGLEFMVPITFIAIVAPLLRGRPVLLAAAVALGLSIALRFLPYNLGVLSAGLVGMAVGVWADLRQEKTS